MSDADRPAVLACANLAWNLVNFRLGLLHALNEAGFQVIAVAPPDRAMQDRLEAIGCRFIPMPIDAMGLSPLRDLKTILALRKIIRQTQPVAWLSWTIKPNVYGSFLAGLRGIPALPNVSGLGTAFIRRSLLTVVAKVLYTVAFKRARTVFFQNRDDCELFAASGLVRRAQIRLLPGSGIDLAHFDVPAGGRPARRNFLMVSRVVADKGVREFVAAARLMRQNWPDARFRLLGFLDVANRTAISADEVQAWVRDGIIEYCDPVSDVRPFLADADFVVLPSYREGLSRVLLEAAAMGRPIVATDVPGCRDIVTDGVTGFLCAPQDSSALAASLDRAARTEDPEWFAMSSAGRHRVEAEFSQRRVNDLYFEAMEDAGVFTNEQHPES
jgi:glycosyltransferase involved in cell wall biosynthesis